MENLDLIIKKEENEISLDGIDTIKEEKVETLALAIIEEETPIQVEAVQNTEVQEEVITEEVIDEIETEVKDGTDMDHNTVECVEGIIDRFEGDYIVVEIEGKMYDVLRSITDEELAEGDHLDVVIQDGEVVSITKNPEKTKTAEDELADLLKDMWK